MAAPRLDNGYTRIANELLEAVAQRRLERNESAAFWWVVRHSYGWQRKWTDSMSMKEFSEGLHMSKSSVHLALTVLLESGILERDDAGRWRIIKDYEAWKPSSPLDDKRVSVSRREPSSPLDAGKPRIVQPTGRQPSSPLDASPLSKENILKKCARNAHFTPPTLQEVVAYCAERKNAVDPQRFRDFYEAKGWMVGRNGMKDWRAAVRTWERPQAGVFGGARGSARQAQPQGPYRDYAASLKKSGWA